MASYDAAFTRYHFADLTITGGAVGALAADARGRTGVAAVAVRAQADVPLQLGRTKLLGRVVGLPAGAQPAVDRVEVLEGGYLRASRPGGVLVERHTAEHFHLRPGDRLTARGPAARAG